jgi:hypothetical protein
MLKDESDDVAYIVCAELGNIGRRREVVKGRVGVEHYRVM